MAAKYVEPTRITLMTAEADSSARRAMIAERSALADRKWLARIEADAVAEIERAKKIATFKEAIWVGIDR